MQQNGWVFVVLCPCCLKYSIWPARGVRARFVFPPEMFSEAGRPTFSCAHSALAKKNMDDPYSSSRSKHRAVPNLLGVDFDVGTFIELMLPTHSQSILYHQKINLTTHAKRRSWLKGVSAVRWLSKKLICTVQSAEENS